MADETLWNPDLAPTGRKQRTWLWYHYAALWVGMVVAVPAWMLAAGRGCAFRATPPPGSWSG